MILILRLALTPLMGATALITTLSQHLDLMSSITLSATYAYTTWAMLSWAERDEKL